MINFKSLTNKSDFESLKNGDYIRYEDFIRIVEDLTKWNKVEDGLPAFGQRAFFHAVCTWKSNPTDTYFDDILTTDEEGLDYGVSAYILKNNYDYLVSSNPHIGEVHDMYVTEWKPID